jgi:alpha-galactosidase/6-phospho-beta-glucosidase family protein
MFNDPLNEPYDENDPVHEKVMEMFTALAEVGTRKIVREVMEQKTKLETLFFSGEFGIIHALKSDNDRTIAEPYQIDDKRLERVNPNADRVIKHNRERSSYRQRAEIKQSIATLDARIEQARELAELKNTRPHWRPCPGTMSFSRL